MELRFLRDTDKRKVDFVVLEEGKPLFAVECKTDAKSISPSIYYFKERTDIPIFFQVHEQKDDYVRNGVRVLPAHTFCREMKLP